jgi:hypothetical protein
MQELDEQQKTALRKFLALAKAAFLELDDSISTGLMSDSKSAVFDMRTAADALAVPEEIASDLRRLAHDSWSGVTSSGDAYDRSARAIGPIGEMHRLLEPLVGPW